jgi:hypothetical protein
MEGFTSGILNAIYAFIFGTILSELIRLALKVIMKRREVQNIKHADKELESKGIYTLSHEEITLKEIKENHMLYIPFPSSVSMDDLQEYNPKFFQNMDSEWRSKEWWCFKDTKGSLIELANTILTCIQNAATIDESYKEFPVVSTNDMIEIIEDSRESVARDLLQKIKAGNIRFNGEMLGVYNIDKKKGSVELHFFKTDYFTNRVMNKVYNTLIDRGVIRKFESPDMVNNFYPFLTALGVDTLIELRDNSTMLVKRSKNLDNTNNREEWHVSMNEAISQTDYDTGSDRSINQTTCVERGLLEELQIPKDAIKGKVKFTDVYFLSEKCEIGIASYVKLNWKVSQSLVRYAHFGAKDSMLESSRDMYPLSLDKKSMEDMLHRDDISLSCRYLVTMWKCRSYFFG